MPTIAVSVKRDVYEALRKLAESKNMSLYEFVKKTLEELASTGSMVSTSQPSEVLSKIDQLIKAVSILQEADRELERKLAEISARVEQLEKQLTTISSSHTAQSSVEHSVLATNSSTKTSTHVAQGTKRKTAIEVLREAKLRCISEMRSAKNPEAIIERMRSGGAVVVMTDEDVCAVDPDYWDLFKRKLNESKMPDDKEVLSKLKDEKMKKLFQLLRKAGALYLDAKTREWVYDYSFIEEPGNVREEENVEEEVAVDWEYT
jgi:cell division septum initiation protein DivIVA